MSAAGPSPRPTPIADRIRLPLALVLLAGGAWLLGSNLRPAPIVIRWETGSEQDVAGFNLWRSEPAAETAEPAGAAPAGEGRTDDDAAGDGTTGDTDGARLLNAELIPAQGSAQTGAAYAYTDAAVVPGRVYVYQIEELSGDGQATRLPERVEAQAEGAALHYRLEGLALLAIGLLLARQALSRSPGPTPRP
ncbi:MAG: hypothetical protein H6648_01580 [Caldilineae bacterium]|nr:hypothetical protein [Chloroflexota bacterium]MCB9175822.1 hypothetical protein [Caldilineae bacterium]